jgi:hypothetical protein
MDTYYKLAKPDGWDFYTGETINYRDNIGKTVKPPSAARTGELCSDAFIHASDEPNKCFVGAKIPCSAYLVQGTPVICDDEKCGFVELSVIKEIDDLNALFGWNYNEARNPSHPFQDANMKRKMTHEREGLLRSWASVIDSVWVSVRASVIASVRASVIDSVRASVIDSVRASVIDSVWASVIDSVWAYIGSLFPNIETWKYIEHAKGVYPFQPCVDLWRQGIVPSYDGRLWRLHSGKDARIIWVGTP